MSQGIAYRRVATPQSLAAGQVANAVGTIFTATGPTVVENFTIYNSSATPQTVNVYVTRSGGSRRQLYQFVLAQYDTATVCASGESLSLSSGDIVEADTTTAAVADYSLGGVVYA